MTHVDHRMKIARQKRTLLRIAMTVGQNDALISSGVYVATRFRYVLVDAADEDEARKSGVAKLYELYEDLRRKLGREVEIEIHILREASDKEIGIWNDHVEFVTRELERRNNQ